MGLLTIGQSAFKGSFDALVEDNHYQESVILTLAAKNFKF